MLAESGVYAGGRYDKDHPDQHFVGQMYVEYQIPAEQRHPYPIVLIHGGGQTGAAGRRHRTAGQAGRSISSTRLCRLCRGSGRARTFALQPRSLWRDERAAAWLCVQKFTAQEKEKLWPQAALHTQWPGTASRAIPPSTNIGPSNIPGMENRVMQAQMNIDALAALLDRIGPSIILVHSQSGAYAWPLAQMRPALVKGCRASVDWL